MDTQQHRPTLLDLPISYFEYDHQRGSFANVPARVTTLRRIITTKYYRSPIEAIRAEPDTEKQGELKKQLPAITPAALLQHRKRDTTFAEKINQQWPLMMGDVDKKDNPGVDMAALKKAISRLPYVLACAYSVRGGIWFGVRLPDYQTPETLAAHFRYLQKLFSEVFGVELDTSKGGNPTDLRFVSYDADPFTREDATIMRGSYTPPKPQPRPVSAYRFDHERFSRQGEDQQLLSWLVRRTEAAVQGNRHITLRTSAQLAGGYAAAGRLDEQIAVCALETVASEWPEFAKSQGTIRAGVRYGLRYPIWRVSPLDQPQLSNINQPRPAKTPLKTRPRLIRDGQIIYGEVLTVEPCDTYPAEWDSRSPDTSPTIQIQSVQDYLNQPTQ